MFLPGEMVLLLYASVGYVTTGKCMQNAERKNKQMYKQKTETVEAFAAW